MPFIILGVALIASVAISLLLRPKIKTPKPEAAADLENPTAEAGRPVPVPFGSPMIKGLNLLWYGDKKQSTYKVDA